MPEPLDYATPGTPAGPRDAQAPDGPRVATVGQAAQGCVWACLLAAGVVAGVTALLAGIAATLDQIGLW